MLCHGYDVFFAMPARPIPDPAAIIVMLQNTLAPLVHNTFYVSKLRSENLTFLIVTGGRQPKQRAGMETVPVKSQLF